ncbi:MAG: hypothetical protein ACFFDT_16965, partial [Candidatus Hodarchaeota archaeon]
VRDPQNKGIRNVQIFFGKTGERTVTDSSGFYSKKLGKWWSGIVTPYKEDYDIIPNSRSYSMLTADTSNQDYVGYGPDDPIAPPTELQAIEVGVDSAILKWIDNSSREDGYIIRRSIHSDTSVFIEVGRLLTSDSEKNKNIYFFKCAQDVGVSDTTRFELTRLRRSTRYVALVTAFTTNPSKSDTAKVKFTTNPPPGTTTPALSRPTDLIVSPRSEHSLLLTWKDNADGEDGFQIIRKREGESSFTTLPDKPPRNSRYYLDDDGLDSGELYYYRVRATIGIDESNYSDYSKKKEARTKSMSSIAQHSSGLDVDNVGGEENGWSNFQIFNQDQLYEGHLQIWTEKSGNTIVYDGDDGDFETNVSIDLYPPPPGSDIEHTANGNDEEIPVIFKSKDNKIEVHQFTYQKEDSSWILIEWTVYNRESSAKNVKLALYLDADAGGELCDKDEGYFYEDVDPKIVYIKNQNSNIHIGMALLPDASSPAVLDNYQINNFGNSKNPDNSSGGGENARNSLFKGLTSYVETIFGGPADLTMTLVSNLGNIGSGSNVKVKYAIAVAANFEKLRGSIKAAAAFDPSGLSPH